MIQLRALPALLLACVAGLALVPAHAGAVEGFAGVLEDGRLVRFTDQAPTSLSAPARPVGLVEGERLVVLGGDATGRLFGVGSSARLYAVDLAGARVRSVGTPFAEGLRGRRFSLAIAPGSGQARLLSDVGQDLLVDLATGRTAPGPGLRRSDDRQAPPALAYLRDGRLTGVDVVRRKLARETEPRSGVLAVSPFASRLIPPTLAEPAGFAVGTNGRGYAIGVLADNQRVRQSVFLRMDPEAGRRGGQFFLRRVDTLAAIGRVPADRSAPRITGLPRRLSVRRLVSQGPPPISISEGAQLMPTLTVGGRRLGFGIRAVDVPGRVSFTGSFFFPRADRTTLRRAVGRRVTLRYSATDFARNRRAVVRRFVLAR